MFLLPLFLLFWVCFKRFFFSSLPHVFLGNTYIHVVFALLFLLWVYLSIVGLVLVCMCELITQSCLTLCNSMDCNLPDSSVRGILHARLLEWVAMPFPRGSFNPGIKPKSLMFPAFTGGFFNTSATWKPMYMYLGMWMYMYMRLF